MKEIVGTQARFWVLIAVRSTLQAACNAVGADRRSGRHCRQATVGRSHGRNPEPSGRYPGQDDRLRIAELHLGG